MMTDDLVVSSEKLSWKPSAKHKYRVMIPYDNMNVTRIMRCSRDYKEIGCMSQ